ncbi:MAG: hypothetical protein AAF843_04200 [Bacteroidota bacterium]
MKPLICFIGLTFLFTIFSQCQEEVPELNLADREQHFELLNPTEAPDRLCQELGISGGELLTGTLPEPQTSNGIIISHFQQSAELSPGTTIYLPLNYTVTGSNTVAGIYLHVIGSNHYWKVPIGKFGESSLQSKHSRVNNDYNSIVLPINLPSYVTTGSFDLSYALYDQQGNTSPSARTRSSVQPPSEACGFSATGNDGLFTKILSLEDKAGIITISYNMYTVPDRMDLKYNGEWVASTASTPIAPNQLPPSSTCYDGTDGYVPGFRTFTFEYDPNVSDTIEVYMFGCFGGGTRWDFWVTCEPEKSECCEDKPSPPNFTPSTVNFPANHEGVLNTGISVNAGDFVFLSTSSVISIATVPLPVGADGTFAWGPDEYKKYLNYELGQLIALIGGSDYGFDDIRLGENECEEIRGDAVGTAFLFRGENGIYLKAERAGDILLELNDRDPANNRGLFSIEIYVLKSEDHFGRNKYNCCPQLEPIGQDPCDHNWDPDNEDSAECYHGALATYRGTGSKVDRSQCTYKDGVLYNQGGVMGTFDYGAPKTRLHMILDVFPHIVLGDAYQPTPDKNIYS